MQNLLDLISPIRCVSIDFMEGSQFQDLLFLELVSSGGIDTICGRDRFLPGFYTVAMGWIFVI